MQGYTIQSKTDTEINYGKVKFTSTVIYCSLEIAHNFPCCITARGKTRQAIHFLAEFKQ